MRKNGVVSVIVPVYGVEPYLEECIESILNQTYGMLEVILVDDGSPDGCGAICDRYGLLDPRIVVVHQKNAGAAAARNTGLRLASGEYITFVDGDDYLEPEAYECMVRSMRESHADIVQSNFRYVYQNGAYDHVREEQPSQFTAPEYLVHFTRDWTCALCWDKLFRHHVLTDVSFEEGHLIDDEFFTYRAVMNAGKIQFIPALTYHYRQRASGVMKKPATEERKIFDIMASLEQRMLQVAERFPELQCLFEGHYADTLLFLSRSDWSTPKTVAEVKRRLRAFAADGKVLFWKDGQRKRSLKLLSFLLTSTDAILNNRTRGTTDSEYKFFE